MHILVFELGLSGHHSGYLHNLVGRFVEQGHRVSLCVVGKFVDDLVLTSFAHDHPGAVHVEVAPENKLLGAFLPSLGIVGAELQHWLIFRQLFKRLHASKTVDRVFFPYLDYCLHAIGLLGPPSGKVPWAGICMRPSFHLNRAGVVAPPPKYAAAKQRLFYRMLSDPALISVFTIDELLSIHTHRERPDLASRLTHIPDPAELSNRTDRASARALLRIDPSDFVILVYGAIDDRKGIDLLLAGIREQHFPRPVRVLAAGRHTPALRSILAVEPRTTSIDAYVDADTEEAVFRAADLVWMGYRSHYAMSGVLVLAACAGIPVIATRNGLIGWMTRHHDLGSVIDCENAQAVTQKLHEHVSAQGATPTPGMDDIKRRHTWDEVHRLIEQAFPGARHGVVPD